VSGDSDRFVEAALFMAGKPIAVSEIQTVADLDARTIRSSLNKLEEKYSKDSTAIEIIKTGSKYCMQVKEVYRPKAEKVSPPDLSKEALKVASLIGYYQPILQSKLSALVGPTVYDGVKELVDHGLVRAKPRSRSVELTTTTKFIEYFGIEARSRNEVKAWFKQKLKGVAGKG